MLREYKERRDEFLCGRPAVRFFISAVQTPLLHTKMYDVFAAARHAVGIRKTAGRNPRLHDSSDFLRRFAQHILPRGFVRIRQYGFLANASISTTTEFQPSPLAFSTLWSGHANRP